MTEDYNTLEHLLEPLELTDDLAQSYVEDIVHKPTEQLQDDYMMIWYMQPKEGYGSLKPAVTLIRLAILAELKRRPWIGPRPRLALRIPSRVQEDQIPILEIPRGYGGNL